MDFFVSEGVENDCYPTIILYKLLKKNRDQDRNLVPL